MHYLREQNSYTELITRAAQPLSRSCFAYCANRSPRLFFSMLRGLESRSVFPLIFSCALRPPERAYFIWLCSLTDSAFARPLFTHVKGSRDATHTFSKALSPINSLQLQSVAERKWVANSAAQHFRSCRIKNWWSLRVIYYIDELWIMSENTLVSQK